MKRRAVKTLLSYARKSLEDERCEQGFPDACGRPAAFEAVHGSHVMCTGCAYGWYPYDAYVVGDDDGSWLASLIDRGLAKKRKGRFVYRIETRLRDARNAMRLLPTVAVDALIVLDKESYE